MNVLNGPCRLFELHVAIYRLFKLQHVIQFGIPQILPNFGLGNLILIHVKDFSFWEKRPTFANFWKQILDDLTFIIGFNKVPSRTQPKISPSAWHVHKELLQKQFGVIGGHVSQWIFFLLWRHSVFEMAPTFLGVFLWYPVGTRHASFGIKIRAGLYAQ